jgi:hypothetical protein
MFSAPQNQCCVPHDHPGADLGTIVGWRFAFDNRPSRLCGRRRRSHKTDCAYDRSRLGLIHCSIPGLGREFATADPVCASVLPTGAPRRKLGLDDRWDSDNDSRLGHPFRSHRKYAALTPNAAASAAVKALPAGGPSEISALTWFTHERANMKRLYRLFAARRRHWRWELNAHICAPSLYVGTSDFSKPTKRRPTRRSILLNYARRLLWLFPTVLLRRPDRRGRQGRGRYSTRCNAKYAASFCRSTQSNAAFPSVVVSGSSDGGYQISGTSHRSCGRSGLRRATLTFYRCRH